MKPQIVALTGFHGPEKKKATSLCWSSPAEQLWIGQDLLQAAVAADDEGEDGLSRVASEVPGYTCREGEDHLPGDLHRTSAADREGNTSKIRKLNCEISVILREQLFFCLFCLLAGVSAFEISIDGFGESSSDRQGVLGPHGERAGPSRAACSGHKTKRRP